MLWHDGMLHYLMSKTLWTCFTYLLIYVDHILKASHFYAGIHVCWCQGYASGSFGPTTAGRMDSYVDIFQAAGGSMVMLAKGNRSQQVLLQLLWTIK